MSYSKEGIREQKEKREKLKVLKALDSLHAEKTKKLHQSNRKRLALVNELTYIHSFDLK